MSPTTSTPGPARARPHAGRCAGAAHPVDASCTAPRPSPTRATGRRCGRWPPMASRCGSPPPPYLHLQRLTGPDRRYLCAVRSGLGKRHRPERRPRLATPPHRRPHRRGPARPGLRRHRRGSRTGTGHVAAHLPPPGRGTARRPRRVLPLPSRLPRGGVGPGPIRSAGRETGCAGLSGPQGEAYSSENPGRRHVKSRSRGVAESSSREVAARTCPQAPLPCLI